MALDQSIDEVLNRTSIDQHGNGAVEPDSMGRKGLVPVHEKSSGRMQSERYLAFRMQCAHVNLALTMTFP